MWMLLALIDPEGMRKQNCINVTMNSLPSKVQTGFGILTANTSSIHIGFHSMLALIGRIDLSHTVMDSDFINWNYQH